ncbi:MAG: WG repeat-containing protein [Acidobacteriota bacterium]
MKWVLVSLMAVGALWQVVEACSIPPNQKIWTKDSRSTVPLFRVVIDERAGYINREGTIVIPPEYLPDTYDDNTHGDFVDGMAEVMGSEAGDLRSWSLYSDGRRTLRKEPLIRAHEGLRVYFQPPQFDPKTPRFLGPRGYRNERDEIEIPAKYAYAGPFSEGLAAIALDGACWVESVSGWRQPAPSAEQQPTSCGPMPGKSVTQPCRHGYIDKSGVIVVPAEFELARNFREGLAAVRRNQKWGFIDRAGKVAVKYLYDEVKEFSEGVAAVRSEKLWEYVDRQGNVVIATRYDDALSFGSGLAPVKTHLGWHYLDKQGRGVIAGPFLQATPFIQGLAHVQLAKSKWAWIDTQGKRVFEYDWDDQKRY